MTGAVKFRPTSWKLRLAALLALLILPVLWPVQTLWNGLGDLGYRLPRILDAIFFQKLEKE